MCYNLQLPEDVTYLVYLECGHNRLASETVLKVLPSNGEMFMVKRLASNRLEISSSRGMVTTSSIKDVRFIPCEPRSFYLRVTTANSVLSLIVVASMH